MLDPVVLKDDDFAVETGLKIPAVVVSFVELAHHRVEPLLPKVCLIIHYGYIRDTDIKYGKKSNDWELMALEEMLDAMLYSTAAIIRYRRKKLTKKH